MPFTEKTDMELLIERIAGTDLAFYADKPEKLAYALMFAASQVNGRRRFIPSREIPYEAAFRCNVIEGAVWHLRMYGIEGQSTFSENGVSGSIKAVPDWLSSVTPRLGWWY